MRVRALIRFIRIHTPFTSAIIVQMNGVLFMEGLKSLSL